MHYCGPLFFKLFIATKFNIQYCIIFIWLFSGFKKFTADIEHMIGFKPNYYWICSWVLVTPAVVMVTIYKTVSTV